VIEWVAVVSAWSLGLLSQKPGAWEDVLESELRHWVWWGDALQIGPQKPWWWGAEPMGASGLNDCYPA
jgi:hypothetical protein